MSNDLTQRRLALIQWAQSCLDSGDFHGLRDAAADLEVIEARLEERAGRTESPPRYATADGTPGPVVWQPSDKCSICGMTMRPGYAHVHAQQPC